MCYYLGIDGGGTKTEAVLSDFRGNILKVVKSSGSNPIFVGRDTALKNIREVLDNILREANPDKISQIVLCIPGMGKYKEELFMMPDLDKKRISIEGDDLNTFYGALGKEYGIVVLTGTGSFVLGINKEGRKKVIGGWGPLIGDPGSGYWIGREALRVVTVNFDGLGPKTILTGKIKNFYKIEDTNLLRREVNPENIGLLAPLVLEAALEGDKVAHAIIKRAAKDLAKMAKKIILELKLDKEEYDLTITGGISKFGDILWGPFIKEIRSLYGRINIVRPRFTPSIGSILMALKKDGVEWTDEILNNLKISYEKVIKDVYGDVF